MGKCSELDFEDDFLIEISDNLGPGTSAVVALLVFKQVYRAMEERDEFADRHLVVYTLGDEDYRKLSESVEDQDSFKMEF